MCNFITATLPAGADTASFREAVSSSGLAFAPLDSRFIRAQLLPDEEYFHATRAMCDCGFPLRAATAPARPEDATKKLRAKGWGEAKIAAWVRTQGPRPAEATVTRRRKGDLTHADWLAFLRDALALREVRYVGLLQHTYSGSFDDEQFTIQRERCTVADVAEHRVPWRANVLYEIAAD